MLNNWVPVSDISDKNDLSYSWQGLVKKYLILLKRIPLHLTKKISLSWWKIFQISDQVKSYCCPGKKLFWKLCWNHLTYLSLDDLWMKHKKGWEGVSQAAVHTSTGHSLWLYRFWQMYRMYSADAAQPIGALEHFESCVETDGLTDKLNYPLMLCCRSIISAGIHRTCFWSQVIHHVKIVLCPSLQCWVVHTHKYIQ